MGLLKPFKVLLCDEITVDLDILGRLDLLQFLREECEQRGATVVYATHIFDGMESWMTHIAFASNGELKYGGAKETIPGLKGVRHLLSTIDEWLRVDRDERARGRQGGARAEEAEAREQVPEPSHGVLPVKGAERDRDRGVAVRRERHILFARASARRASRAFRRLHSE